MGRVTITEFIEARAAEREAAALAAAEYPGKDWVNHPGRDATESVVFEDAGSPFAWIDSAGSAAIGEHIAWHDPRRVLREVAATRAIVADHLECEEWNEQARETRDGEREICATLRAIAAIDDTHPDYDPSWTPNPT